jgi:hypothetical protein
MKNPKNVAVYSVLTFFLYMNSAMAGPFGLEMGITKENLDIFREVSPFSYELKSVPKPHSEFETYAVVVTPKEGLCKVIALGKRYLDDPYGEKVRLAYSEVKSQLDRIYGKSEFVDLLKPGSVWIKKEYWVMSIIKNDRKYAALWNNEKGSSMKDGIKSILLNVKASSLDASYVGISYELFNYSRCQKEISEAQSGNL